MEMTSIRSFLRESALLRLLILGIMLVAAFCLRLYGIDQPPMEFHTVRQYHGALLARGLYEWWLTGDLRTLPPDGIIEPPILELLASFFYLIVGGELLWIPRLLSALFWMVGGVFVYLIAKKIASPNAALFSVFFYLFVPYSILPSRAFMLDPLMVMSFVIAIFTIVRYHEQPQSRRRLIVAAAASSLAVFVKPGICFFQIFAAFVALSVYRQGIKRSLFSWHMVVFAVLIWRRVSPGASTSQDRAGVHVGGVFLDRLAPPDRNRGGIRRSYRRAVRGLAAPLRITESLDNRPVDRLFPLRIGLHLSHSHPRLLFFTTYPGCCSFLMPRSRASYEVLGSGWPA
jgi:Dolichyl-phosphate-mannose-protein mannosyltransferase